MEAFRNLLLIAMFVLMVNTAVYSQYSGDGVSMENSEWNETMGYPFLDEQITENSTTDTLTPIVAFSVYDPIDKQISNGEVIKYNKVLLNVGDHYNAQSGVFTAPVSGLYQFSATICNTRGNYIVYNIVKGSEVIAVSTQWDDSDSCNSVQALAMATAGEGVFVKCDIAPSGFSLYENIHRRNSFTGVLLHATYSIFTA